jgi:protein-tyrosine-phosphatase
MSIKRILIVCEGNTCRSPMAAAIAGALLGSTAEVQSAGLETSDGLPATRQAKAVMKEMGLDVSRHRSRSIRKTDLVSCDLIIAMTSDIASKLRLRGADSKKILSLNVSDPHGCDVEVYRTKANEISEGLKRLFDQHAQGDFQ